MKIQYISIILLVLIVCIFAQNGLPTEHNEYYMYWGEERIGYFMYDLEPVAQGWIMRGHSFMDMAAGNRTGKINRRTTWKLDSQMNPVSYEMVIDKEGRVINSVQVAVFGDTARIITSNSEKEFIFPDSWALIETSLPEGWILFCKKMPLDRDEPFSADALLPTMQRSTQMTVWPGLTEGSDKNLARQYTAEVGGIQVKLYVKLINRMLTYWALPDQGINIKYTSTLDTTIFYSEKAAVNIFEKTNSQALIRANVDIKNPMLLKKIELSVEFNFDPNIEIALENEYQKFNGDVGKDKIVGQLEIEGKKFSGDKALAYPAGPIQEPEKNTLVATDFIQSQNEKIVEISTRIAEGKSDFWQVTRAVNRYLADSIDINNETLSSVNALIKAQGDGISHARLSCAMLRALGIPCKIVGGVILNQGMWIRHHWVMVWMGNKDKWIGIDPTTGEDESFSASHVALWEGIGMLKGTEQSITIESHELWE